MAVDPWQKRIKLRTKISGARVLVNELEQREISFGDSEQSIFVKGYNGHFNQFSPIDDTTNTSIDRVWSAKKIAETIASIGYVSEDDVYFRTDIDAFLDAKSSVGHLHDDRYYVKSAADAKFALKDTDAVVDNLAIFDINGNPIDSGISYTAIGASNHYTHPDYPSVSTTQEALDVVLYTAPDITSFTNNAGTVELGTIVTTVTLNWAINKDITSQSLNQGIGALNISLREYIHGGQTITSDRMYTLQVGDGIESDSRNTNVYFRNKRYWDAAPIPGSINSAFILSLSHNELNESKSKTFTVDAGTDEYIWFIYPKRSGIATFWVGGFEGGFEAPITVSFTNSSTYTEDYYVYRSTNPNLGSTTVTAQ